MHVPLLRSFVRSASLLVAVSCGDDSASGDAGSTGSSGSTDDGSADATDGDGGPDSTGDGDGGDDGSESGDTGPDVEPCTVVVDEADCDTSLRPFVFVHGTFGSGADFANVAALMGSNGWCQDRIVAVDYNSLGDQPAIDGLVDQVLADHPEFDQVDLAGHSQGTMHCGNYLADSANAAKIAHYINFSGSPTVDDVPTLSVSSQRDLDGTPRHASGNMVTEVTFTDEDHFAVAASRRAFIEVYQYLVGRPPEHTSIQCGAETVTVVGVTESFADNVPETGNVEIRRAGALSDTTSEPVAVLTPDANGRFEVQLDRNVAYEFKGLDDGGALVGYVYMPPFRRSNYLTRLLVPSSNPLIASQSTDRIVRGPNHTAIVARWSGGALRQDLGASLTVDGVEVLTSENAGEQALMSPTLDGGVVGFFMYDADENMQTDLGLVASGPFLSFTDVFIDATEPTMLELVFTAGSEDENYVSTLRVPSWPSADALLLVTF